MKMPMRILLVLLCAAMIIALPFIVSSPNMLNNVKMELMNEEDDGKRSTSEGCCLPPPSRKKRLKFTKTKTLIRERFPNTHPNMCFPLIFRPHPRRIPPFIQRTAMRTKRSA